VTHEVGIRIGGETMIIVMTAATMATAVAVDFPSQPFPVAAE
jgi:hypothetical protein